MWLYHKYSGECGWLVAGLEGKSHGEELRKRRKVSLAVPHALSALMLSML